MQLSSKRVAAVDAPIIPTIAQLVREHPGTISLGQGVVNYGPPSQAVANLGSLLSDSQLNKYQSVFGLPELLASLEKKLADENLIAITPENQVMVTAGSNMAFLNAILAVSEPGDEFILPRPFFFNQEMAIRLCGCVPVTVATQSDWQLDLDAIKSALTKRTRAVVTVSPNNPTGAVYDEASLTAVNRLCAENGIYHFSDEAYESFTFDQTPHFSPASLPGASAHTLSFFSLSKNYGMASWRVGYAVFPANLTEAMSKVQDTNLICPPVVSQLLANEVLKYGKPWLKPKLEALATVRQNVHEMLGTLPALIHFPPTTGAFYVLMYLPPLAAHETAMDFTRFMVSKHRVITIPGFAFGLNDPTQGNYQRLSFGALDAESVSEGVSRFLEAVRHWYA